MIAASRRRGLPWLRSSTSEIPTTWSTLSLDHAAQAADRRAIIPGAYGAATHKGLLNRVVIPRLAVGDEANPRWRDR